MLLAVILVITGIAAIILEFFVPAFGLVGIVGAGSITAGIIAAFRISSLAGSIFLTASLIIVPVLMLIFFKVFPRTFIGRKLILHRSFDRERGFESTAADYSALEGCDGLAATDLRPAGMVVIAGEKYNAVTAGEYIDKGVTVRVVRIDGNKITVRKEKER